MHYMYYKILFLFIGGMYLYFVWDKNFEIPPVIMMICNIALMIHLIDFVIVGLDNNYNLTPILFCIAGLIINLSIRHTEAKQKGKE